ncbi:MAG TPA: ABC-type transport auxiliary lipoprotein family protein, partial [Burkholderiaceae bacterium]|nr:ABC-type transport auxiliary lipoprotein family protein [Burkholderiaceae bacterium]
PDYRVAVEVRSFESTLGEVAAIDAVWTVRRMKDRKTQTGQTAVRERIAEPGYEALAAAHSRAAAKLSQDIADAIRQLQRDAP